MAVTAKFSGQPLQVVETPEMVGRLRAIAERDGVSMASVVRDILSAGIRARERRSLTTKGTKK